jgi:hypothetical protein
MMRYELTDLEWSAIKPFLPNKPRGVPGVNDRRVLSSGSCDPGPMARPASGVRSVYHLLQPLRSLASRSGSWMHWQVPMTPPSR